MDHSDCQDCTANVDFGRGLLASTHRKLNSPLDSCFDISKTVSIDVMQAAINKSPLYIHSQMQEIKHNINITLFNISLPDIGSPSRSI